MYQPGVISGFGGFEKGPNYEDPLTRKKFCEEAEKYISAHHKNCIITMKMDPRDVFRFVTDVLYAEAKKWFCTSFTRDQRLKTKDWNGFVSLFREKYCKIPDRLKSQVAALTPNRMDEDLKDIKTLVTDMTSQFAKQAEDHKETVKILVGRIEHLETSISDLRVTVHNQKETITVLQHLFQSQIQKQKLSKDDFSKSVSDRQKHLQEQVVQQKQEIKHIVAVMAQHKKDHASDLPSHLKQTSQQFNNHKASIDKLTNDLQHPSLSVDKLLTSPVSSITHSGKSPRCSTEESCTRCGKSSHSERNCGARLLQCYTCGKKGHLARCCRQTIQADCRRCNSTDHKTEDCGALKKGTVCWLCLRPGHLYRCCKLKFKIS